MRTLIINIETVGTAWGELDAMTQRELTQWIETTAADTAHYERLLQGVKDGLRSSPVTGQLAALGVYDVERGEGTIYSVAEDVASNDIREDTLLYKTRSEVALLREFWDGVREYEVVVTFNGRALDLPFIIHRSVARAITPSIDLLRYRYLNQQSMPYHVDLKDQLTFYGAMNKRPNLSLFCRMYGIQSLEIDRADDTVIEALGGHTQMEARAQHVKSSLLATAELYKCWQTHVAPAAFRNEETKLDF